MRRCIPFLIENGAYPDNEYGRTRAYGEYSNIWADGYRPSEEIPPHPGDDTTVRGSSGKKMEKLSMDSKEAFVINCVFNKYPLIRHLCEEEWKELQIPEQPPEPDWGDKFPQKPGDDAQPGGDSQLKRQLNGQTQQLYQFDMSCDQAIEFISDKIELDSNEPNKFSAVAVIGDRFYHGKFLPYAEIAKAAESMNGAYHDINHWGTTYTDGNPNIEYIIGYQKNTTIDPMTKRMKTDIHINENAPHYKTWKNFIDVSKQAGRTPNVSVSFWGSNKKIKAKELPKGINFSQQGYSENDDVTYLYDLQFQALSTVFQGACDDKAGCGIGIGLKQDTPIVEDELSKKKLELEIEIEKQRRKK